ncbi:hypothetical protein JVU11DRAFT_8141 [Chiua virens]|nr:hypothetical protein JVU11DRAFT_8141 [Chiua virens]
MNSLIPRASLKRSPRTRTRKNSISETTDIVCLLHDSTLSRRKTRPPPLQIIPEMSENGFDISPMNSPATARLPPSVTQKPASHASCITLSAYTFSVDDALLMFGGESPGSPTFSASSSTSDGASSEGVPPTPRTSDDEDGYDFLLPTPRLRPQRISIRPLCITKARSMVCHEDDDNPNYLEKEEACVIPLAATEEDYDPLTPINATSNITEEAAEDFYSREFEGFISFSPVTPFFAPPARRDSLILTGELPSSPIEFRHRSRSRHSKPLPLLPPTTPPISSFPLLPTFPMVQTTAQKSVVRRRRNILSLPDHPPSLVPAENPSLPRISIPLDIEDGVSPEEDLKVLSRQTIIEQAYDVENASVYSQPSFEYARPTSAYPLPPAMPETPLLAMYGKVTLPRSSTDSDAPRSSVDSTSSFASSASSDISILPLPTFPNSLSRQDDESEAMERLRSRWSSSTLASLAPEQQRSTTLLSPLKNVFVSRPRRVPPQKTPPQTSPHLSSKSPKNKRGTSTTTTSPNTPPERIRRQQSRSSTSSAGTNSSDGERHNGSPSRTKRKPFPVAMFLRAT